MSDKATTVYTCMNPKCKHRGPAKTKTFANGLIGNVCTQCESEDVFTDEELAEPECDCTTCRRTKNGFMVDDD